MWHNPARARTHTYIHIFACPRVHQVSPRVLQIPPSNPPCAHARAHPTTYRCAKPAAPCCTQAKGIPNPEQCEEEDKNAIEYLESDNIPMDKSGKGGPSDGALRVSVACMSRAGKEPGFKKTNQDNCFAFEKYILDGQSLFGALDGHGPHGAASQAWDGAARLRGHSAT